MSDSTGGTSATAQASAEAPAEKPPEQREFPLGNAMLQLEDPVSASMLGRGPLRPEPIAGEALSALREAYAKAEQELGEARSGIVEPQDRPAIEVLRFAVIRAAHKVGDQTPARSDLGYAVIAANRFLDEAEYQLAHGPFDCTEGVKELGTMLTAAGQELGASSVKSLKAAKEDLGALKKRIEALPRIRKEEATGLAEASAEAIAALDALSKLTAQRIQAMGSAKKLDWGEPVTPAGDGTQLRRLPDKLGAKELRRRFRQEEGSSASSGELIRSLALGVARMEKLAEDKKIERAAPRTPTGTPVDVARCEALAKPIVTWGESLETTKVAIDCSAIVRKYGDALVSDADLALQIMDWGVLAPTRRNTRKEAETPLALVSGRIVPPTQLDAAAIAMSLAVGETPGLERAVQRALGDACLATVALWHHGELGTTAELEEKLAGLCSWKKTSAWITEAERRPRAALAGLAFVAGGKRGVSMLNSLWWAPFGMPEILSKAVGKGVSGGPRGAGPGASPAKAAPATPPPAKAAPEPPAE